MKAQLHKLPLIKDTSFLYAGINCNYFNKPWHFHEEYELVLIKESRGTKFIGDNISLFQEGDLYLIGPNIPHIFRNSEEYYKNDNELKARSIFIHFTDTFLGSHFFELPEMKLVKNLLDESSFVLKIIGNAKEHITNKLTGMSEESPPQQLLSLLEILIALSESKDLRPLLSCKFVPRNNLDREDTIRINKILEFILKNFKQKIYISEMASMLCMSEASFSRYFKHHTLKNFSTYVTEVRISHACRLLMQGEDSISQIGYASGFENLSNFYRHFKKITGLIPKEYQNRFLEISKSHNYE